MRKNHGEHGWNFFYKFVIRVAIKSHYLAVNKVFREPTAAAQLKLLHGVLPSEQCCVEIQNQMMFTGLIWHGHFVYPFFFFQNSFLYKL